MALHVPQVGPDADPLSAALAYAKAGLYVGPVKRGDKHPGSVLGSGWPRLTSTDPEMIVSWMAGTDHGVMLHAGRSGLVVLDVDTPERLHPLIRRAIDEFAPPFQNTRRSNPERGHYVFELPPGRMLGNSLGDLAGGWGEVRGRNGLIIVAPSHHPEPDGLYRWRRTGQAPTLPDYLAERLPDAMASAETVATPAEVSAFTARHTVAERPELVTVHVRGYVRKVEDGESRHDAMCGPLASAMREAAAGLVDARTAVAELRRAFVTAVARPAIGPKQGRPRTGAAAESEWNGLLAWAVAAAATADPEHTRARAAEKVPEGVSGLVDVDGMRVDTASGAILDEDDKPESSRTEAGRPPSAATRLTSLARARYAFGCTPGGEPYAVPLVGPRTVRMLRGSGVSLRAELASVYLDTYDHPPSQQALADAMTALEGLALREPARELHMRTALHDGALWIDIGDHTGDVIRIAEDGWSIQTSCPVLHRRTALTAPMVRPLHDGGDVGALWEVLNVAEADRGVLLAWLLATWMPETPRPILLLGGEQGTGKSTASRALVGLVDPSTVPLRKPPKDAEAWTTAALGSSVVAVDNVSALPPWLSDAMCRASTGDGDVKRRLYSDGDLHVFSFRRAVIVNGIDVGGIADDLADRLVTVELSRIHERTRRPDAELSAELDEAAPVILAGLLDLAVSVLATLPTLHLDRLPRMADFARVAAAVDVVAGTDAFTRYAAGATALAREAVTGDPVLVGMTNLIGEHWTGTAADLLDQLDAARGDARPPRGWPSSARTLAGVLRRRAPSLRRVGWSVEQTDERTKRGQVWAITPPSKGDDSGDESGDETVTSDEPSPPRHPVRHPQTPPATCTNVENGRKGDEVTTVPPNLILSTQTEVREAADTPPMREVADISSPRHSHHRTPLDLLDERPRCQVCGTRMGRADADLGTCSRCRRTASFRPPLRGVS